MSGGKKDDFQITLPVVLRGMTWIGGMNPDEDGQKNQALEDIATALYALVYAVEASGGQEFINNYKDPTGTGCFDYAFNCVRNLKEIGDQVKPIGFS